jgi:hypothetical protein
VAFKTTLQLATDNSKALDAFIAAKLEIDTMLERLKALSDDHFETNPDEINWGHFGTLSHYRDKLREITDMAFREGEHAG